MVLKAEGILREIDSAGYQVTGGRESIGDGQDGPLRGTARNIESRKRHITIVHTKGIAGDAEALRQLGEMLGITLRGDAA